MRHLVLPGGLAGRRAVLEFIAGNLSRETWVNLMDQSRPCFQSDRHSPLDRRPSRGEFAEVVALARELGLSRLDGISV